MYAQHKEGLAFMPFPSHEQELTRHGCYQDTCAAFQGLRGAPWHPRAEETAWGWMWAALAAFPAPWARKRSPAGENK